MFGLFITDTVDNADTVSDKFAVKEKDGNKKINSDFSQLCEDTYGNLKNYIFRFANGDIYLTEEIIQDTYEYAAKNKKILLSHPNPKAWFYKTAKIFYLRHREKSIKIKNNEKNLPENISEDENDFLINGDFTKLSYDDFKDATILDEIMSELSEKEKELILCQFADGLSVKKIAENWNENYEALRKFNYRMMKKIKELLEGILHV